MTYLDNNLILEPTTGSAIAATRYTANWMDLQGGVSGNTGYIDIGRGKNLYALFTVITAAGAADAATLELQVVNTPATTEAAMSQASSVITVAADTITWAAHGFPAGTMVQLTSIVNATGVTASRPYFVAANALAAGTFKLSETLEAALSSTGAIVAIGGTDGTATVTAYPHIMASSGPIAPALLTAGTQVALRLNKPLVHALATQRYVTNVPFRYLAGRFVETGTFTTAVIKCELIEGEPDGMKFYPTAFTIT